MDASLPCHRHERLLGRAARGAGKLGKEPPLRSFGMFGVIRPARVSPARSRYPWRWFSRGGARALHRAGLRRHLRVHHVVGGEGQPPAFFRLQSIHRID